MRKFEYEDPLQTKMAGMLCENDVEKHFDAGKAKARNSYHDLRWNSRCVAGNSQNCSYQLSGGE